MFCSVGWVENWKQAKAWYLVGKMRLEPYSDEWFNAIRQCSSLPPLSQWQFSLSFSPCLPPSWALVPGWQLLMGRRRVVFIIMPLFIHVSVASDSQVYASLYFLPASLEMSHIHHPLSLSFSHSLSVLSSSQVLLLLSLKKSSKKCGRLISQIWWFVSALWGQSEKHQFSALKLFSAYCW